MPKQPKPEPEPDFRRTKTIFFRVTETEYSAAVAESHKRNMPLGVWARKVFQQKLGIEEAV